MPKPSFEEYLAQCAAELGFGGDVAKAESQYRINLASALQALQKSAALAGILARLRSMRSEYVNGDEALLFYRSDPVDLTFEQKPFRSAVHKLYRHNISFNRAFPKGNPRGVKPPARMYEDVDDLLRSRIICKYMDGPSFVCKKLEEHCASEGVECQIRDQSTDAGYYAWHFYFKVPVEISVCGDVGERSMWVEIQLSTQLAEAITVLTHGLYEARREGRSEGRGHDWKWDANSPEFRSAYIGHGLHLLEGMIQGFRDDVLRASNAAARHVESAAKEAQAAVEDEVRAPAEGATQAPAEEVQPPIEEHGK